ncbi:choline transporter-like protein 3 [Tribolium madens]|uniref:choline transporter-like protein 3 n=1 Tax=Tribolium madens TaxID=41895 RepID=UPI001CF73F85|nr:choline transporter-like protein 3 [Tribolium madens]
MSRIPENLERFETEPEYKKQPVDPIYIFRGVARSAQIALPELAENRKCTDIIVGVIFGIAVLSLFGSAVYIASNSDIRKLTNGADGCGNICGVKNTEPYNETCPGKDFTDYPYLDVRQEECITANECKKRNKTLFGVRCMTEQKKTSRMKQELFSGRDYYKSTENIVPYTIIVMILMPSVSSGLAILVYIQIKRHPKCSFYFFTITTIILLLILAAYCWYSFITLDKGTNRMTKLLILCNAVAYTVLGLVLLATIVCRYSRIYLLIEVYRETLKAIFNSKLLLLAPLVTMAVTCFFGIIWLFMAFLTFSVKITEHEGIPPARIGYFCFLFFMGYWIFLFIEGCQCMVVAGTIASYYFSRNRDNLEGQYCKNVRIVVRFHLGSVATGSLLITIAAMIRILVEAATSSEDSNNWAWIILKCIINCILKLIEEIINYFSQKAYIMTAIHGKNFWSSGKRAIKIIWHNFLDTISVDGLNSAVQFSASILILLVTLLVGWAVLIEQSEGFVILNILFGFLLASAALYVYFSMLTTAVGTIFLCYCEDVIMNDGSRERPYFMSKELEETLDEALEDVAEKREAQREEEET